MSPECLKKTAYHGPEQATVWSMTAGYSESVLQRSFVYYRCHPTSNQSVFLAMELYQGDAELLQQQQGIATAIKKALLFDQAEQSSNASEFRSAVSNGNLGIVFCSRQGARDLIGETMLLGGLSHALVVNHGCVTICPAVLSMMRQPYIKRPVWQEMQKFMAQYAG